MQTVILSTDSTQDFANILELANKLNIKAKIVDELYSTEQIFQLANETSLNEWLTPEEDEAWKNL